MRILLHKIFIVLVMFFHFACTNEIKHELNEDVKLTFPISYEESQVNMKDLKIQMGLRASPKGDTLLFYAWISNHSNKNISLSPYLLEIQTDEDYRCVPIGQINDVTLKKNTTKFIKYRFTPVNNKLIYYYTGQNGDLNPAYHIKLSFLKDQNGKSFSNQKLTFPINPQHYHKFKTKYAEDHHYTFYELNYEKDLIRIQENKLRQLDNSKQNQHINTNFSEKEISLNGLIFNNKLYHFKDSLYLNLRVVNHGNQTMCFSPNQIQVINHLSQANNKQIILKKGYRFQEKFNLGHYLTKPDGIKLNYSTFQLYPDLKEIFSFNPEFRISNVQHP